MKSNNQIIPYFIWKSQYKVRLLTMDIQSRAEAAQKIAREAGEMLRHHGKIKIREKAANDFVTEMDVRSETMIREALLGHFPEDEFFGEEGGGARVSRGRWIVDPIDGTQSFMRGHHGYCISIAYECEGELVLGCIYVPDTDEMFLAVRGQGATLNGQPIHVSDIANPAQALAHLGYGHRVPADRERTMRLLPGLFAQISDIRRYGSAAYALCCVACGRSEIFFELGLKIYDIAAGIVIVGEAGGRISGWSADEDCRQTGNILATNSQLHGFMLNQLNA